MFYFNDAINTLHLWLCAPWATFSSGGMEAHPTLEYQNIKGDKTCGGPLAAISSGAVEAHPTLEYQNIKGDKTYVEAPGQPSVVELNISLQCFFKCFHEICEGPACPVLNPAMQKSVFCKHLHRKEGNALFNDALNTFYLRFYGVGHIVNDRSHSERENPLPPHVLLFSISSKGYFMCTIPQTGLHFVSPVVHHWLEREIAQWVHHEESI